MHYYQAGLLDRWGTPGRRPPLEKDPQTLKHRDCRGERASHWERKCGDRHGPSRLSRHRLGSFYGLNIRSHKYTRRKWRRRRRRGGVAGFIVAVRYFAACTRASIWIRHSRQIRMQVKINNQIQVQIFTYLLHQTRWRRNLFLNRQLNFRQLTCYRQSQSAAVMTTSN